MNRYKKGVTLVALVVTVIVIAILAATMLMYLYYDNDNPLTTAERNQFRQNLKNYEELLAANILAESIENPDITTGKITDIDELDKLMPGLKDDEDFKDKIIVEDGKIVVDETDLTDDEKDIVKDLDIKLNTDIYIAGLDLKFNLGQDSASSSITATIENVSTEPESYTIYFKYTDKSGNVIGEGWIDNGTNTTSTITGVNLDDVYTVEAKIVYPGENGEDITTNILKGEIATTGIPSEDGEIIFATTDSNGNKYDYKTWIKDELSSTVTLNMDNVPNGYILQYKVGNGIYRTYQENQEIKISDNTTLHARLYNPNTTKTLVSNKQVFDKFDNKAPTVPEATITSTLTSITVTGNGSKDEESGLKGYKYSTDGINYSEVTKDPYSITGLAPNSDIIVYVKAVDNVGNESSAKKIETKAQEIKSTIKIILDKEDWTDQPIKVTLTADNIPAGYEIWYKINEDGTYQKYTGPFEVSENCIIYAKLYNPTTQKEAANSQREIKNIDKGVPIAAELVARKTTNDEDAILYTPGTWTAQNLFLSMTGGDGGRIGLKQSTMTVTMRAGSGESSSAEADFPQSYSTNDGVEYIELTETGIYDVTIVTENNIGKTSTRTVVVQIDKAPPSIDIAALNFNLEDASNSVYTIGEWTNATVIASINDAANNTDVGSGIKEVVFSIDGGDWTTTPTSITETGKHTVILKVTDNIDAADSLDPSNEATLEYSVNVDKEIPLVDNIKKELFSENLVETAVLTIENARDTDSGLQTTPYSFDGGVTWQAEPTFTFTQNQSKILVQVKDVANNIYEKEMSVVELYTTGPTLTIEEDPTANYPASVSINAKDPDGITKIIIDLTPDDDTDTANDIIRPASPSGTTDFTTNLEITKNGPIEITGVDTRGNETTEIYEVSTIQEFITEWTVTAGTTITLPIVTENPDIYVKWGDGNKENVTTQNPVHTYTNGGTYEVQISGYLPYWNFSTAINATTNKTYVTSIRQWGILGSKTMESAFDGCVNINVELPTPHEESFTSVTSFKNTFNNCSKMPGVLPDTLFDSATNATIFEATFANCSSLNATLPENLFAKVTQANTFKNVFLNCSGLTDIMPRNLFSNNTKVASFEGAFSGCSKMSGYIPANLFSNNTAVTSFASTFLNCSSLSGEIPVGLFDNNTGVTTFKSTFEGCTGLNIVNLNTFSTNLSANNFENTFKNCSNLGGSLRNFISSATVTGMFTGSSTNINEATPLILYTKADFTNADATIDMYKTKSTTSKIKLYDEITVPTVTKVKVDGNTVTVGLSGSTSRLTTTKHGSGIQKYQYSLDKGETWIDYNDSNKPVIDSVTYRSIVVKAVGVYGYESDELVFTLFDDRDAPIITIEGDTITNAYPSILTITITDLSGLSTVELPDGQILEAGNGFEAGAEEVIITYNATKNGPIVIKATDASPHANVGTSSTFTIQNVSEFITEWTTTAANTTISLPLLSPGDAAYHIYATNQDITPNIYVDWGDGTKEYITTNRPTHTYATAGKYQVQISGYMPYWCFGRYTYDQFKVDNITTVEANSAQYLTKIVQWGPLENIIAMDFMNCTNLAGSIPGLDTSEEIAEQTFLTLESAENLFWGCTKLTGEIPEELFKNCLALKNLTSVFYNCTGLTGSIPETLFENCGNAIRFWATFYSCTGLTGNIPENLFVNCTLAENFQSTFSGCSNLSGSIPAGLFKNNTNVIIFQRTFAECSGLIGSIPEELFANCPNVQKFTSTFYHCTGLTGSIPANLFSNNTKVISFNGTFDTCTGITGSIPETLFTNNKEVTNFGYVFMECSGLTGEIPENLFSSNRKVTNFACTFHGCRGLTKLSKNLLKNSGVSSLDTMNRMFHFAANLAGELAIEIESVADYEYAFARTNISGSSPLTLYTKTDFSNADVVIDLYKTQNLTENIRIYDIISAPTIEEVARSGPNVTIELKDSVSKLTTTKHGSGIGKYQYSYDGGTTWRDCDANNRVVVNTKQYTKIMARAMGTYRYPGQEIEQTIFVDTEPPKITSNTITNVSISSIKWDVTATDNVEIAQYRYFVDGTLVHTDTTIAGTSTYTVTGLTPLQEYTLKVIVTDSYGNETEQEKKYTITDMGEVKNITTTGYDVYFYTNRTGLSGVQFPSWTTNAGQDDLIWHSATNKGNGVWHYRVNRFDHKGETGQYTTHLYVVASSGTKTNVGKTLYATLPDENFIEVRNLGYAGYDVYVYSTDKTSTSAKAPSWSAVDRNNSGNAQEDIIWGTMKSHGSGTYSYRVNISDHGYDTGLYHTHIYFYYSDGSSKNVNATSATVPVDSTGPSKPVVTLKLNNASGSAYNQGWTESNIFHIVTSQETESNIIKYQYSHDNTTWYDLPNWQTTYNANKTQVTYLINWAGKWDFYIRTINTSGIASQSSDKFVVAKTQSNIMVNGSFEYGYGGTQSSQHMSNIKRVTGSFDSGAMRAYQGSSALWVDSSVTSQSDCYFYMNQTIPVTAGKSYRISYYYASATSGSINGDSSWWGYVNSSGSITSHFRGGNIVNTSKAWTLYTTTITVPSGVTGIRPRFGFYPTAYSWFVIDAIKVEPIISSPSPYTETLDATAPIIDSVTASTTAWTNGNVTMYCKAHDYETGISGYAVTGSSATPSSWTGITNIGSTTCSNTTGSNGTFYHHVKNGIGLTANRSITVSNIDKTAPYLTSLTGGSSKWVATKYGRTITAAAADGASGVSYYQWYIGTSAPAASTGPNVNSSASAIWWAGAGDQYVWARPIDTAGNVGAWAGKQQIRITAYDVANYAQGDIEWDGQQAGNAAGYFADQNYAKDYHQDGFSYRNRTARNLLATRDNGYFGAYLNGTTDLIRRERWKTSRNNTVVNQQPDDNNFTVEAIILPTRLSHSASQLVASTYKENGNGWGFGISKANNVYIRTKYGGGTQDATIGGITSTLSTIQALGSWNSSTKQVSLLIGRNENYASALYSNVTSGIDNCFITIGTNPNDDDGLLESNADKRYSYQGYIFVFRYYSRNIGPDTLQRNAAIDNARYPMYTPTL